MPFPAGVDTVTLTAGAAGYRALDGEAYAGTLRLTPSVSRVVSAEHGVIALGVVNITVGASGQFVEDPDVLACDADGFEPSGWTYRVDEEFTGAPGRAYSISLPAAVATVALPTLSPVESSSGTVTPGGGAVSSVNGETGAVVLNAADVGADPEGTAAAAVAAHSADTTAVHGIADTALLETTAGATAKVSAHAALTTSVHGIANTAALETQTGAQGKADAAQAAAATDATTKVTTHTGASDPHGDRAYANGQFATQATVSTIDGFLNDALTRVAAIEGGTAFLDGAHFTGDVEVIDSELIVRTTSGDVGKLRPTPWLFDVTDADYGAVGDARVVADGAMTTGSTTLTSATLALTEADEGKSISVKNAGANGVTTLLGVITTVNSPTSATLSVANASGGNVTGAIVIVGTDDTAAIQAAVNAAEAYLAAGRGYAQVYFPPRAYVVAGPLNNTKSGNGQIVFGVYPTTANKKILEFRGATDGAAAVRHWQQTVPQTAGSCLISFGVYASTSAQTTNINADGNPGILSGPNEGFGYGVSATFSNIIPVLRNLALLNTHSSFGLTYGAYNFYGCANAILKNVGWSTAGVVPGTDYTSPGVFGTGLSIGGLLPAPGNNDLVVAENISVGGGYTYAMFLTEHGLIDRYMALYCWAGLVAVGTYFGSVGSVHAMRVIAASIEACTNEVYIMGAGSSGIGPILHIDELSTESGTPNVAGQAAHMAAARGRINWTGLFTESGLTHDQPTGIESVNAQAISPVRTVTGTVTARPIDRVLKADASSAAVTVNLPSAAPNPVVYTVIKTDASANTVTIDPSGSQTINGDATKVLSAQWETVTLRSDGANWIAI